MYLYVSVSIIKTEHFGVEYFPDRVYYSNEYFRTTLTVSTVDPLATEGSEYPKWWKPTERGEPRQEGGRDKVVTEGTGLIEVLRKACTESTLGKTLLRNPRFDSIQRKFHEGS